MRQFVRVCASIATLVLVAVGLLGAGTCQGPAGRADALSGSLIAKDSKTPVANATLVITTPDGKSAVAKTISDEAGRFVVVGMRDGLYKAWATKDGFFEESRTFSFPEERRLEFTMQAINRAAGVVKRPDGGVAQDVTLTFTNVVSNESFSAVTGPDGRYEVSDMKPGDYRLLALSQDGKLQAQRNASIAGGDTTVDVLLEEVADLGEGIEGGVGDVTPGLGNEIPQRN